MAKFVIYSPHEEGWLSWFKAFDLKSNVGKPTVGSNPTPSIDFL